MTSTVGGNTMGSETIASTTNFHRQRDDASQYPSGNPIAMSITETRIASRSVSASAWKIMV